VSTTDLVKLPCHVAYPTLRRRLSWARAKGLLSTNRGGTTFGGHGHLRRAGWRLPTDLLLLSRGALAATRRQGGHQDAVARLPQNGAGSEPVLRLAWTAAETLYGSLV